MKFPIVDLGGWIVVIDFDSDNSLKPKWKRVAKVFPASITNAKRVATDLEIINPWLRDDTGCLTPLF